MRDRHQVRIAQSVERRCHQGVAPHRLVAGKLAHGMQQEIFALRGEPGHLLPANVIWQVTASATVLLGELLTLRKQRCIARSRWGLERLARVVARERRDVCIGNAFEGTLHQRNLSDALTDQHHLIFKENHWLTSKRGRIPQRRVAIDTVTRTTRGQSCSQPRRQILSVKLPRAGNRFQRERQREKPRKDCVKSQAPIND